MTRLTEADLPLFVSDFELYCGTIKEITNLHGPHEAGFSNFGGIVHTWIDSFQFTVWGLKLTDPVESLRQGHRREVSMKIPKLHKDPALVEKYRLANLLYKLYNSYSNVTEKSRRPDLEEALGYRHLPSYMSVVNAIVADYRSYGENLEKERLEKCRKN